MNVLHRALSLTCEEEPCHQRIEEVRHLGDAAGEQPPPRRTLRVPRAVAVTYRNGQTLPRGVGEVRREPLKGHEAFLKALELSNADVVVEKCDAVVYHGKVRHSDRYTITLRTANKDGGTTDRVIFKHDISEFHTTTAARTTRGADADDGEDQGHDRPIHAPHS